MKRGKFPNNSEGSVKGVLDRVHSDVVGPISPTSIGGCKYLVTFIDEYSHFLEAKPIKRKGEVLYEFRKFQAIVELGKGRKIKEFQSDNGGEYTGHDFIDHLDRNGILHRCSFPYTPQQNGMTERMNQTLMNSTRCLLIHSGMPHNFWGEALGSA
ncbi:hypothetical protein J437_LFUL016109 [Ladona fulva]|uniref:Integrase catalytic domain-containing protein n=1 Tax=Ladona fulva TaxID=123851 RepID=A0A8K0KRM5_LADFU|nr:hypothetical protein J437_LFUL016109 [Ladona fulva]